MQNVTEVRTEDILERVLLREVELARANEALRHEHFQRRRVEKVRETFADIGEKLADAASPREASLIILEAADRLFGWDAAFVDVYSEEDKRFHGIIRYDLEAGQRKEVPPSSGSVPFTPLREQLFNQGPILILRPDETESTKELLLTFGASGQKSASLMFVPMTRRGAVVGVLSIQSYQTDSYTERDLELLRVLGNFCCHGLQRGFAETQLRNVQHKLGLIEKMVPMLLWTTNEDMRLITTGGTNWGNVGLEPEQAIGQLLSEVFEKPEELLKAHRTALAGTAASCECALNGYVYRARVEPMPDHAGRITCCLAVLLPS